MMLNPPQPVVSELNGKYGITNQPIATPVHTTSFHQTHGHHRVRSYIAEATTFISIFIQQIQYILDDIKQRTQKYISATPSIRNTIQQYTPPLVEYINTSTQKAIDAYHTHLFIRFIAAYIVFWLLIGFTVASIITVSITWPFLLTLTTIFLLQYPLVYYSVGLLDAGIDERHYYSWCAAYLIQLITFIPLYIFAPLIVVFLSFLSILYLAQAKYPSYLSLITIPAFLLLTTPYWSVFWYLTYLPISITLLTLQLIVATSLAIIYPSSKPIATIKQLYTQQKQRYNPNVSFNSTGMNGNDVRGGVDGTNYNSIYGNGAGTSMTKEKEKEHLASPNTSRYKVVPAMH